MTASNPSFLKRLWLGWLCAFRVLFDPHLAGRVQQLMTAARADEAARADAPRAATPTTGVNAEPAPTREMVPSSATDGALQLLALLQREGRWLDFVQQDITSFADDDVGAAARLVHEGCQRALRGHARVVNVRTETEGSALKLERATEEVKLVGNVAGAAPFRGVLRHRGWRVEALTLPTIVGAPDLTIVAAAELELS